MSVSRPGKARGLTVRQWFALVFAAIGLLVLVASVTGTKVINRSAESVNQLVNQIDPARTEALALESALVNQETGVRGYVLTADREFLEPYTRGLQEEKGSLARLKELIGAEPELAGDLERLRAAAAAWRADYAEPMIAQVAKDGADSVPRATTDRSKAAFDGLRALNDTQNQHLKEAAEQGRDDLAYSRKVRKATFQAMPVVFLLAGIMLAIVLYYAVGRPLDALAAASRRVSDGDFSYKISTRGPADVRQLAGDVEAMRGRIAEALALSTEREEQLQKKTADLDVQANELRRSNAELEQFAYVASHDLQEPLRKIVSFCQMLERRYSEQLDDRGRQYIGFAVDGARRMQVLINDLLDFSRVGRVNDERHVVRLGECLDKALNNLEGVVEETGARVERPAELPEIDGNSTLLTMLWQNLVGNAIKFRSPDRDPVVTISLEEGEEHYSFSVTDNGIGIDPEYAEKIFVIFQRLHHREAYPGSGIGLAMCKKIVDYHGGRIWLDTEHTGGTSIRFTLPRSETAPAEAAAADRPEGAPA